MRPLNEILQALKEKYGYTDQEINNLFRNIIHFSELSYKTYEEQNILSENNSYDKPNIKN